MENNNGFKVNQFTPAKDCPPRVLTLDVDLYQEYLDSSELSDEQRTEMLEALWTAICCFVDLGYKIDPEESCG